MSEFAEWESFYLIVGSAAGAPRKTTQPMLALRAGYDVLPKLTLGLEAGVSRVEFGSPLNETANVSWTGLAATYRF
jgi:hypothetical protein